MTTGLSNKELFKAPPKKVRKTREAEVEKDGKARVTAAGGHSAKFKSPGHRSRPDQIELYGTKPMLKVLREQGGEFLFYSEIALQTLCHALLAAGIQFTEYKRPGEQPTTSQVREHERLRALGFTVNVIDQRTPK